MPSQYRNASNILEVNTLASQGWALASHAICDGRSEYLMVKNDDCCLITAAPELLEALKEVVRISDRKHVAWDKARAAIAKAEGKE